MVTSKSLMTQARSKISSAREWPNPQTASFWSRLSKDAKVKQYWAKYAESTYRRSLKDERNPGIWPKYSARIEVAMNMHGAVEEKSSHMPKGFSEYLGEASLDLVDFYGIAEKILDDGMVRRIEANARTGSGRR